MDALRRDEEAQHRVDQISVQLQQLTEQLSKFRPASEQAVGVVQTQVSQQLQQRFDAQIERIDKFSISVNESQKSAQNNAEMLRTLLVGIENMGEKLKKLQEDMVNWLSDYQHAEREYEQMNEDLLQEVSLSVSAVTRPETAANLPVVSLPQVTTPQFSAPQSVNVSQSAGQSVDAGLQAEWVTVQALKKPYPCAPLPPLTMGSKGFNVGSSGQDSQERIPQFFNFVGSNAGNEHVVNKTPVNVAATPSMKSKAVPNATPEDQCEKGWYISAFDGKKKRRIDHPAFVEQQRAEWGKESLSKALNERKLRRKQAELSLKRKRHGLR